MMKTCVLDFGRCVALVALLVLFAPNVRVTLAAEMGAAGGDASTKPAAAPAAGVKGESRVTPGPGASSKGVPQKTDTDWATYNKDFLAHRFSPLKQITADNAGSLKEVCRIKLAELTSFHTGPILIDGIMYVTTARDTVALDPRNCAVIWKSTWEPEDVMAPTTNRGVAFLNGRLFRGTNDGRIIALDAKTGKQIWKTVAADPKKAYYMSAAPIAWNGLVFMGTAGSDAGIRGRMMAYDAATRCGASIRSPCRTSPVTTVGKPE
jgi:alcohol dehydrogenase (cytochrome c)